MLWIFWEELYDEEIYNLVPGCCYGSFYGSLHQQFKWKSDKHKCTGGFRYLAADSTADTQAPNDIVSDSESAFADTDIEADSQSGSASSESSASADITDIGYDHLIIGVDDTFCTDGLPWWK